MCDCKSKNEARLTEHFAKQLPEGAKFLRVELGGFALILSEPVAVKNVCEAVATYSVPTKGTAAKPSVLREKKEKVSLVGSYCMFCGEKYATDKPEAAAVASAEVSQ